MSVPIIMCTLHLCVWVWIYIFILYYIHTYTVYISCPWSLARWMSLLSKMFQSPTLPRNYEQWLPQATEAL